MRLRNRNVTVENARNQEHPDPTPSEPPVCTVSLQNIEKSDIVCDIAYDIFL